MSERNPSVTCDVCGLTWESTWSDAEAIAESKRLWGEAANTPQAALCDPCYTRLLERMLQEVEDE